MVRRAEMIAVALAGMMAGYTGAKPPGGPSNPHGTGKEPTPIEREYHLPAMAESRLTDAVPSLPVKRLPDGVLEVLRMVRLH